MLAARYRNGQRIGDGFGTPQVIKFTRLFVESVVMLFHDPADADREMLQALHDLRREGDLTEDEFRSIKNQIVGRLNASWTVPPKTMPSAKTADPPGLNLKSDEISENVSSADSETVQEKQLASQSNQPESFASPTNVPEPPQDTSDLSEGLTPPESENSQGHTEAGPAKNTEE